MSKASPNAHTGEGRAPVPPERGLHFPDVIGMALPVVLRRDAFRGHGVAEGLLVIGRQGRQNRGGEVQGQGKRGRMLQNKICFLYILFVKIL